MNKDRISTSGQIGAKWDRDDNLLERLRKDPRFIEGNFLGESTFNGRTLITQESTKFNGGVYLGSRAREAIVVDDGTAIGDREVSPDERNKQELLRQKFDQFCEYQLEKVGGDEADFNKDILKSVYDFVGAEMPFDSDKVKDVIRGKMTDQEIHLADFFGGGECRHQSLFVAYLLEKIIGNQVLKGKISIERNTLPLLGAHSWVRYTDTSGGEYIIDPTRGYFGKADNQESTNVWIYNKPKAPAVPTAPEATEKRNGLVNKFRGVINSISSIRNRNVS